MSNITPTMPSFVFGYWRPWKENSNLFDSYLDYARDTSLVKYGADTIGQYINQASREQVQAINELGQAIGMGMNILSNQMSGINKTLSFINRNIDVQIEQQKLSNLLLQNIAELLRVPDSEKERQHSIELGIKFFVNASKDTDLYADALEELLKAESLMKQDYFVLHRIGFIFLFIENFIDPEKALDYFVRAAKYASVESGSQAAHLASVLTNNFNTVNTGSNTSEEQIGFLAADSYEKAAFAAYILGRFSDAVNYQKKALKLKDTNEYRFVLSKYQIRNGEVDEGIINLNKCMEDRPIFAVACLKEIDLINEPKVLELISEFNNRMDDKINLLIEKWGELKTNTTNQVILELNNVLQNSLEDKVYEYDKKIKEYEICVTTITVGNQVWMIDNLNVSTFRNGDPIPEAKSAEEWERAGQKGQPACCYYDNNSAYGATYGKLYNWYAVNDPRGLAPVGFHIPSDQEWTELTEYLGGEIVAGTKMKSTREWAGNGNGSNNSGFSGLPGGARGNGGAFGSIGEFGNWWSSTEDDTSYAWSRYLYYNGGNAARGSAKKKAGYSVRCLIRD